MIFLSIYPSLSLLISTHCVYKCFSQPQFGKKYETDLEGLQAYMLFIKILNCLLSLIEKLLWKMEKRQFHKYLWGKVRMCPSKFHCNGFFSYHTDITERQAINKKCVRLLFQLLSSLAINLALDWSMQKHFVTPFPQICSLNFFFYAPATSHLLDCQPLNQGCHLLQVGCCKWSIGEFKTQLLLILIGIKCLHKMPQPKLFVVLSDTIHRQIIKFQAVILNHLPNRIRIYKVKK